MPTSPRGRGASSADATTIQDELRSPLEPDGLVRVLRPAQRSSLFLDGRGGFGEGWLTGQLVAVDPQVEIAVGPGGETASRSGPDPLSRLDRLIAARRQAPGGAAETGIAVLIAYDFLGGTTADVPSLLALSVDRSVRFGDGGSVRWTSRGSFGGHGDSFRRRVNECIVRAAAPARAPDRARSVGPRSTSLPRSDYLAAVARIREHIVRGDIYQANLSQQFSGEYRGDELELYLALASASVAPHSAFVEALGMSLASVSPETFVRSRGPGQVETWPIKGTRPRDPDVETDRRAARELLASSKDGAELLMIVDLERNDLSRVCRPGSVRVSELRTLRSYPAVHHLVAGVHGTLQDAVRWSEVIRATFPGGSITGAPKRRAMEIIGDVEPAPRGYFTGSFFWFADDGTVDSSILIRTLTFADGRFQLGAGGGIVADSDPHEEWLESNHKARALAHAMGFDPADAH